MLAVLDFDGDLRPFDCKFEKALAWIKVYDLPLNLMNVEVAKKIGNKIGDFIKIDIY